MAKKQESAVTADDGAGFVLVEPPPKEWDVAMAYALLSDGTIPPVLRGEDLEDS